VIPSCRPFCNCDWRKLFDRKGIYSIDKPVPNVKYIFLAINTWTQGQAANQMCADWTQDDAMQLINVIESVCIVSPCPAPSRVDVLLFDRSSLRVKDHWYAKAGFGK